MSEWILFGLTTLYALLMLTFTFGLARTKRTSGSAKPSVSVVVPMRNEEKFAEKTLNALAAQDYSGDWEVICVDDRSTDSTGSILDAFAKAHEEKFRVLHLDKNLPLIASPKKRALENGFREAKNEILLIMDADCTPSTKWLSAMAGRFEGDISIVQGPKKNTGKNSIIHQYQKLETLAYTSIEAAGFSLGRPMLASAACLAYRRDLFFKVGGFGELVNLSSGDDDMLVHKMMKEPNTKVCYNLNPDALIETAPVDSLSALFFQRARWGSNGTHYESAPYIFLLSLVYAFLLWIFVSPIFVLFFNFPVFYAVFPIAVKVLFDTIFLSVAACKLDEKKLLFSIPITEIIQVPMIVFAVPFGLLGLFKWK